MYRGHQHHPEKGSNEAADSRPWQKCGLGWFAGSLRNPALSNARRPWFQSYFGLKLSIEQTLVAPWDSVFQSIKWGDLTLSAF